jgi:hypothetical protein
MIEQPTGFRPQAVAVVALAPVPSKLTMRRRQVAKHKLAAVDVGCPNQRNHIHPDRKEGVTLGRDEPPSPVAPLSSKEARWAKADDL